MMAPGDVVRLPHGRGKGIALDCSASGDVLVFVGRGPDGRPIVDQYIECELMYDGRHLGKVARLINAELQNERRGAVEVRQPPLSVTG